MLKLAAFFLCTFAAMALVITLGAQAVHALWHPPAPPLSITCVAQVSTGNGTYYQVQPLATTPADCSAAIGTLNSYGIGTVKAVNTVPQGQAFMCQGLIYADSGDIWASQATGATLTSWLQSTCEAGTYSAPTEPK